MYIFGEYTQEEEIRSILGIEYNSSNWLLPENFLVEDSHYKIILLKNRKIVYEEDFKQLYSIIDRGLKVKKVEEKKMTCYCRMYPSPIFLVEKIDDKNSSLNNYFYLLKNVQNDGTILPRDTIETGGY